MIRSNDKDKRHENGEMDAIGDDMSVVFVGTIRYGMIRVGSEGDLERVTHACLLNGMYPAAG